MEQHDALRAPRFWLSRRAVTFTELLVSITIVLSAVGVVAPTMSNARYAANVAVCASNLQEICTASALYIKDNDPTGRGSVALQPWFLENGKGGSFTYNGISYTYASEFVYGGFRHRVENPNFPHSDTYVLPTEWRPYNKYIAPGLAGRDAIKNWVCPADKSSATPLLGSPYPPMPDTRHPSWEVNGNSYALNWYWPAAWGCTYAYQLPLMTTGGAAMLSKKVGGAASEFVLFMEGMMNAYMMDATPPGSDPSPWPLGMGWHGKRSKYTMGFHDGHAEYRFIDTRHTGGPGWDTWPEADTQWPACSRPWKEAAR